eukprot:3513326-Rhodomonas_salina.3
MSIHSHASNVDHSTDPPCRTGILLFSRVWAAECGIERRGAAAAGGGDAAKECLLIRTVEGGRERRPHEGAVRVSALAQWQPSEPSDELRTLLAPWLGSKSSMPWWRVWALTAHLLVGPGSTRVTTLPWGCMIKCVISVDGDSESWPGKCEGGRSDPPLDAHNALGVEC